MCCHLKSHGLVSTVTEGGGMKIGVHEADYHVESIQIEDVSKGWTYLVGFPD